MRRIKRISRYLCMRYSVRIKKHMPSNGNLEITGFSRAELNKSQVYGRTTVTPQRTQ